MDASAIYLLRPWLRPSFGFPGRTGLRNRTHVRIEAVALRSMHHSQLLAQREFQVPAELEDVVLMDRSPLPLLAISLCR